MCSDAVGSHLRLWYVEYAGNILGFGGVMRCFTEYDARHEFYVTEPASGMLNANVP